MCRKDQLGLNTLHMPGGRAKEAGSSGSPVQGRSQAVLFGD
jgi:hypothetical protein